MMTRFYSTEQVAKMCNVSRGSVIRWIHRGNLEATRTAGGHHRVAAAPLRNFLLSLNLTVPDELQSEYASSQLKPVVLIVDDESSVRHLLHSFIRQHFPDFQIEEAADGFDAGVKAFEFNPALILLDIGLPGINGLSVCKKIRNIPELSHCCIIVITGLVDDKNKEEALKAGATDFLHKPFDLAMLKQKVQQHLKNKLPNSLKEAA
jgi:two-component system, OmpR family, response regulator